MADPPTWKGGVVVPSELAAENSIAAMQPRDAIYLQPEVGANMWAKPTTKLVYLNRDDYNKVYVLRNLPDDEDLEGNPVLLPFAMVQIKLFRADWSHVGMVGYDVAGWMESQHLCFANN